MEKRVGDLFVVVETEGVKGFSSDSFVVEALAGGTGGWTAGGGGGCAGGVAGNGGSGMACVLGDAACES